MSPPHHSIAFYTLEALALALFGAGCVIHLAVWLQGAQDAGLTPSRAGRLLLRVALGRLATWESLRALFLEAVLQVRLRQVSPARWAIHLALFGGFLILFFIGSLGDWLTDRGLWAVQKDTPWFAIVNEVGGLLLLGGALAALARRHAFRQDLPAVRGWKDDLLVLWLVLLVVTGYLVEGSRIALEGSRLPARFSFLGWQVAALWRAMGWNFGASFQAVWWLHAVLSLGFVAYLPYSPVCHMFTAPLSVLFSSPRPLEGEATRRMELGS